MSKSVIFTDSCVDLNQADIEALDIRVVPLLVAFGEKTYKDGTEITQEDVIAHVEKTGELPATSAVAPGVFKEAFEPYIEQGFDIVYCGIGAALSASYNSAVIASNDFPDGRIFCVDSGNLSSAIGLLILKACRFRDEGMNAKDIALRLSRLSKKLSAKFVVDTLDYIHKGGRCSGVTFFFGKHLKIHPILKIYNGALKVHEKPRGSIVKAWDMMLDELEEDLHHVDLSTIMVTHCLADEGAKYIIQRIKEMAPTANVMETRAGSIISSHCGPNTIGILYLFK